MSAYEVHPGLEPLGCKVHLEYDPDHARMNTTAIERDYSTFRPSVVGTRRTFNDLEIALGSERDPEALRSAWEGLKSVGSVVADRLGELVRLRNEAAKAVGQQDFYHLKLALGTSLGALLLPVGVMGVYTYHQNDNLDLRAGLVIGFGIFFGAWVGARLAHVIPAATLISSTALGSGAATAKLAETDLP